MDANSLFYCRHFSRQLLIKRQGDRSKSRRIATRPVTHHTIKPILVWMKMIKASLVMDDQCDQHADGQPHRQTKDIDEGKNLVFKEISQRDFDVVSKHDEKLICRCADVQMCRFEDEQI